MDYKVYRKMYFHIYFYISSQNSYSGVVDKVVTEMMPNVFQTDKEGEQIMAALYTQVQ